MTHKISSIKEYFRERTKKTFNFLTKEYGFRATKGSSFDFYTGVLFRQKSVGLEVRLEIRDSAILIYLYKLIDGKVPDVLEETRNISCLEHYLGTLYRRKDFSFPKGGLKFGKFVTRKDIDNYLKYVSKPVKEDLDDFLKGDFTIFDQAVSSVRDKKS